MKQGNAHQSFDELDRIIRDQAEKKLDVVVDVKDVQFLPTTIVGRVVPDARAWARSQNGNQVATWRV